MYIKWITLDYVIKIIYKDISRNPGELRLIEGRNPIFFLLARKILFLFLLVYLTVDGETRWKVNDRGNHLNPVIVYACG